MSGRLSGQSRFVQDVMAALSVAAVTLSLSGAFGLLSGRGVLIGMLSAALHQCIAAALGGTRLQCSGPTGPMTTMFVALSTAAASALPGVTDAQLLAFMSLVIFLSAVIMVLAALLRAGSLVNLVPNVVISGFMDGIALIIWYSQLQKLFRLRGDGIDGAVLDNVLVAGCTVVIAFIGPRLLALLSSRVAKYVSGTLIALLVMTVLAWLLELPVGRIQPDLQLHSWQDVVTFAQSQSPTQWPWHLAHLALPLALQLAGVAYLDTLLTSLIMDRQTGTTSRRNKELSAQGIATVCIALIGGIPGAQATERSVLMLKEGAQTRLAGVLVGIFALVAVLLLQNMVTMIPQAVFAGILLKLGYDVFDWQPLKVYCKKHRNDVWHLEMLLIAFTAMTTVVLNVMYAISLGTALFFGLRLLLKISLPDLHIDTETEGLTDEP